MDGRGRWYATPRAYIEARVNALDSPLPQAEKANVVDFVWDIVSAQQVGGKGGLDRNSDGEARC
jgi:hypothetical protein